MARGCIALLLSLAFAGAPLLAVQCQVACVTEPTVTDASSGHGAHHHPAAPAASSSIGQAPEQCGHDHNALVATASTDTARERPAALTIVATLPASLSSLHGAILACDVPGSSSPPGCNVCGFASPIRI